MAGAVLSKTVSSPNVTFSSDEIRAAGGPWKNFRFRVTAMNETGSSAALEVNLTNVVTDIKLTNQGAIATENAADFVTQVTGNEKPSNYAGTTITFRDYETSFAITGNGFTKSANPGYKVNLWTREYTVGSGFVSGEFISYDTVMGLSNDGQAFEGIKSLEFALLADSFDNKVKVYEGGFEVYDTGRSNAGVWSISYDGVSVRYFCDGVRVYTTAKTVTAGWTMYAGFNARDIGDSVKNIQFGIMGDQALAQLAINTIANIASDNQITAGSEKRNLIDTYNRISAENQRLISESNSFINIYGDKTPIERRNASDALAALIAYLNSLTPAWNLVNANTAVDGPTLTARFKATIEANLALQTANNVVLRTHADWDGVTGEGKDALIKQSDKAATDARASLNAINIIQSDGFLSIDEKPTIIREVVVIKAEQGPLVVQAVALGVSQNENGPIAVYLEAYRALLDYLQALTPAYDNLALDTAIVGTTFSGRFSDYYFARTALINASAAKASTQSTWSGTKNDDGKKPADNADVTKDNTSKDTAHVGGRPAADLLKDLDVNTDGLLHAALRQDDYDRAVAARTYVQGQPVSTYLLQFRNEQTSVNSAVNTNFSLLGAKTPDGTGWVMNLNSIQIAGGRTLAQRLDEVGVDNGQVSASIKDLREVTADLKSKVLTSVSLTLTANGYVSGYKMTNDGTTSAMTIIADRFEIVQEGQGSTGPIKPFRISGGTVFIDRLVAGSITYDALVQRFTDVGQQNLDPNGWYQVFPGGMIMQGGRYRSPINSEVTRSITFPRPFPTQVLAVGASPFLDTFSNVRDLWLQNIGEPSLTGATFGTQSSTRNDQRIDGFDWWAWGR